jgi:predicted GNAT family acetyltransferase
MNDSQRLPQATTTVNVCHDSEARTFEAYVGDAVAGVIVYERSAGRVVLTHTIVEPEYRGRGVGSQLVRATLELLRDERMKITNYCSFVDHFIDAHPDFRVLIDTQHPGLQPST